MRLGIEGRRFDPEGQGAGTLVPEEVRRRGAERAVSGSSIGLCDREGGTSEKVQPPNNTTWKKTTELTLNWHSSKNN